MFNPNGESSAAVVLDKQDCDVNRMIPLTLQPLLACQPMQRFI
ncbi:MAG TPA: hypothetical protein VNS88_18020 [Nitrospiraceae bacterium]|nr:hypothetical protein [Nitrospiraceae bacterium]